MDYKGVIIEESLADKTVLQNLTISKTRHEKVTEKHQTPWLSQWTLDTINIPEDQMENLAIQLSIAIDNTHKSSWYIDCKNNKYHYIIFKDRIFKVEFGKDMSGYKAAREYGLSLGIPLYQMTFERLKR